ncbi:poly(R)-hydroxyalkanoic acid synthase subunit PhaE [Bacillus benzoevorans]|uniref:Poly(3-hydroxyalkanoate) polymerase subunit PhaE n=1 Tax=Bacillus benzoevorans TaxID=1456 RepID=A0A7X0LUT9_9BACI|nr:poly(R)-hydroxyalkanoic acid synthase subunit PhaE [Bacillus benzoevorans]MBB6443907.1 polyhydroxyalkanoic acid synthase PhaR subunit [Bacillus benzoevorans]
MTQQSLFDPFAFWKSWYDRTEAALSEMINEQLEKESFAQWMGQFQSGFLAYQQMLNKTSDIYLKQFNIPSREEISNIASLIINVEEKLENLDEKVEDELFEHSLAKEVTQLKTSISKLEKKMDQFVNLVLQERVQK